MTNTPPIASASPVSAMLPLLYEPTTAFQQLEARPRGWVPLLVLLLSSCVLLGWYFSVVDFAWLLDQILATVKSAEEREQTAKVMTKSMLQMTTIAGALLMMPALFVLIGGYLMLASKTLAHGISFGKGFALAAWSNIPGILLLPLGALQILLAPSGQLTFSELNPISLNQLLFHYDMAHPLSGLMDTLSLTTFWSIFLMVIGLETWARVKRSTAIMVVIIPHVIIYGLWFAYGMSRVV